MMSCNEALYRRSVNLVTRWVLRAAAIVTFTVLPGMSPVYAQNPVVLENQQAGSSAWQIGLPGYFRSNDTNNQIRGYASATSVNKGQDITFYVTVNPAQTYNVDVYRVGWYQGLGGRLMQQIGPLNGVAQRTCPVDLTYGLIECGWSPSYTLTVPSSWTSGVYLALLTNANKYQTYILFVVRDDGRPADILYQQPVTTYQAYNNYPDNGTTGKSLFDGASYGSLTNLGTKRAVKVSFDRPYTYTDHTGAGELLRWEIYFIRWLEKSGYDVAYSTNVDTHVSGSRLPLYKAFLSIGHDEYWTKEMYDGVEAARDAGTNLGFFGANNDYFQMRFEPSSSGVPNRVVVCYKDENLDPIGPPYTTVAWRRSLLGRAEQKLVGVMYTGYINGSLVPYVVQNSGHWVYAGSGFRDGDSVPGILGYAMDKYFNNYPKPPALTGTYVFLGASPYTDAGTGAADIANSSIYQTASRAWVFGAGTTSWSWGLDNYTPTSAINTGGHNVADTRIQRATSNLLDVFVGITRSQPPVTPGSVTAAAPVSSQVTLTWTDNSVDESGFLIERSADGTNFTQVATAQPNSTTYTDSTVSPSTTYYYRVAAYNTFGASGYSNVATILTPVPIPIAPASLAATSTLSSSIALTWSDLSNNEAGFSIERSLDGNTFTQIATTAPNTTTYNDLLVTSATTYYYRVKAYNSYGASAPTGVASAIALRANATSNPIVIENQQPGTDAWQIGVNGYTLSDDVSNQIRGYASAVSVNKGASINLQITVNPAQNYTIDVYRMGWYGGKGGRLMQHIGPIAGLQQPVCPVNYSTGIIVCPWSSSYTLNIPSNWTSGIYVAQLTNSQNYQSYIIFTVRDDARPADFLFQQSVTTYQAYNNYPDDDMNGKSLYDGGSYGPLTALGTKRAVKVSFDRPYTYPDHSGAGDFFRWEFYTLRWMEASGYDVTYTTDVDTHVAGARLLNYKAFLSNGHDEYWSKQMYDAADNARDGGTNLAFTGANGDYYQIRFEPSATGVANRVQVCYKDASLDPVGPPYTTITWRSSALNRAEQKLMGVMYSSFIDGNAPAYPYVVSNSGHWIYAGTGLRDGDSISGIVGYEMDRKFTNFPNPPAVQNSYTLLSDSPYTDKNGLADRAQSSIYQASSGALVFATGTIYWSWGLDNYVPPAAVKTGAGRNAGDYRVQRVTANLLDRFASSSARPPAYPTDLAAGSVNSSSVALTWTDNANLEDGFRVQRSSDGTAYTTIATLAVDSTSYADSGLSAGVQYYYRVEAYNSAGSTTSQSLKVTTTGIQPPAAPSALMASAVSASRIDLGWADNATTETGFSIERSTNGVAFTQIGAVGANVLAYSDSTAAASTAYTYRVRAYNAGGNSAYSNLATATTPAVVPPAPAAPASLVAAAAGTSQINLSWTDQSINEDSFRIERSPDGTTFTLLTTVAANVTSYSDSNLTASTTYYYRVVAVNTGGASAYSNVASATTASPGPVAPNAPTQLAAVAQSQTKITLSWSDNSANEDGFTVERSPDGVAFSSLATVPANVTTYTDMTVTAGTTYHYRVRAYNTGGDSAWSNSASATTPGLLLPPSGLAATAISSARIDLTWTDNSSNEDGFNIERSTDNQNFTALASVGANATTYSDTTVAASTAYYYRVSATSSALGSSAWSSSASATTPGALAAPSGVTATPTSTTAIALKWTDNATAEDGFSIERSYDNQNFIVIGTVGANVTGYSDSGLTASTTYYYRVKATSTVSGPSAYSAVVSASTPGPLAAPTSLTAAATSASQINLQWTDNSTAEDGFSIDRSTDGTNFTPIATVAANITTFSDMGLTAAQQYFYRVRATSQLSGDSAYSNTAQATTALAVVAPTNLSASALSSSSIKLTWTDNSSNETGFSIEQSSDGGATFTAAGGVAANVTTFTATGLAESRQYFYRVRANAGNVYSGYSNIASATTPLSVPAAASNLAATSLSTTQINLNWMDNSGNETGFSIERATGAGTTFTAIATVTADVTTYSDSSLTAGTSYTYRVRAQNSAGSSAYSNTATATTKAPPAAPSKLNATAVTNSRIDLKWQDNSTNETGFAIERSTNGTTFTQIATVGGNVVSYSNIGLLANTKYTYRVRALNADGYSAYSNSANASTPR